MPSATEAASETKKATVTKVKKAVIICGSWSVRARWMHSREPRPPPRGESDEMQETGGETPWGLLGLDAGGPDDRPPLVDLGSVKGGKPLRRLLLA